MSTCTYCGKELSGLKHIKNVTYFELYGREFCFECYGLPRCSAHLLMI